MRGRRAPGQDLEACGAEGWVRLAEPVRPLLPPLGLALPSLREARLPGLHVPRRTLWSSWTWQGTGGGRPLRRVGRPRRLPRRPVVVTTFEMPGYGQDQAYIMSCMAAAFLIVERRHTYFRMPDEKHEPIDTKPAQYVKSSVFGGRVVRDDYLVRERGEQQKTLWSHGLAGDRSSWFSVDIAGREEPLRGLCKIEKR